ncbi:NAD-dependent epimerase/dehydratase family protein [bacterium]|nr:NAD-dependent epimerase/dehydratase family protein [bacterium]
MRILLLGGTRFIGRALVDTLLARGDEVTIYSRGLAADPFGDAVGRLVGDREDRAAFRASLAASGDWDAVVDLISYGPHHAADAVAALTGRVGHFVHISTGSVYAVGRRESDRALVEGDAGSPAVARWPLAPGGWDYGIAKRGAEEVLMAAHAAGGFPETRLRLPTVEGPWDHSLRSWRYQLWLQSGHPVELPGGGGKRFTHVSVGDVATGVVAVLAAGKEAQGEAFNLAQSEAPTLREYLVAMGEALGVAPGFVTVPLARYLEGTRPRNWQPYASWFSRDSILDISKARRLLNFEPSPMAEWLPRTCAWFDSAENNFTPPSCPPWED